MTKRTLLAGLALLPIGWLVGSCSRARGSDSESGALRIVSLAPSITEALTMIGAAGNLVGVSDFCEASESVPPLPRLGTGLDPNYEAIARLAPNLIVTEANAGARRRELQALGEAHFLPWLSLPEVARSIRELGRLTGKDKPADALALRLLKQLNVAEPLGGPRVLLVLGEVAGPVGEIWFIRKNSLHGAALHAAGARNAVPEATDGPPRLSTERLLALDPDAILMLAAPKNRRTPKTHDIGWLTGMAPLKAVRENKVRILEAPEAFSNGPRILDLVEKIRTSLSQMGFR